VKNVQKIKHAISKPTENNMPDKITALYAGVIIGTKPTKPENTRVLPI